MDCEGTKSKKGKIKGKRKEVKKLADTLDIILLEKVASILYELKEKGYNTIEANKDVISYIESGSYVNGAEGLKGVIWNIIERFKKNESTIGVRLQSRDRDYYKKVAEESFKRVYESRVLDEYGAVILQDINHMKEIKEYYYGYIKKNRDKLYSNKEIHLEMNKQALLKVTVKINNKVSKFFEDGLHEVLNEYIRAIKDGEEDSKKYLEDLGQVNYFDFCIGSLNRVMYGVSEVNGIDKYIEDEVGEEESPKVSKKNKEDANKDKKRFDRFLALYEIDIKEDNIKVDSSLQIGNGVLRYRKKDIYIEIIGYSLVRCQIGRLSSLDTFTCKVNEPVRDFADKILSLFQTAEQIDKSVDVENMRKILLLYVKASDLRKNRYLKESK